MKAVVLHEYGSPDQLKYQEWPDPQPDNDQILVRTAAIGVNPIDWKIRSGAMKAVMPVEMPAILGFDYSGVVEAVGKNVKEYAAGDKVFGRAMKSYAELVIADPAGLAKMPSDLDPVEAAALPVILNTGHQLITEAGNLKSGQTVVITGALGAVGRTAVYVAKTLGAHVIAGVRASQLEAAEDLGAVSVLALDDPEAMKALAPVDVVADTVGQQIGAALLAKIKPGGTYASVVGPPATAKDHPDVKVVSFSSHADAANMRALAGEIAKGSFTIPVDRTMPLADAAKAHAEGEKGGAGKIVLLP